MKRWLSIALAFFLVLPYTISVTVSFLPDDVVIPTQPQFQGEPVRCHGLAYAIAKLAVAGEPIEVYRVAGPSNAFPDHNAGPYIIRSSQMGNLKQYLQNFVSTNPFFSNVTFDYLGTTVSVDVTLIAMIKPLKTCVINGQWDHPTDIFSKMGIPFSNNWNECVAVKESLIVFGCDPAPPPPSLKNFIFEGGTLATTDWREFFLKTEFSHECVKYCGATQTIWEGKAADSFDLAMPLKKFFQVPNEKVYNWHYLPSTFTCGPSDPKINVLASGTCGQSIGKPAQALMVEFGRGRHFYFAFHIEGGGTTEQAAIMSALYAGALSSKLGVFPMNCDDSATIGQAKVLCQHLEVNNHSFLVFPALETIKNVKIRIEVDGTVVNWIVPSENNFDLASPKYIDLTATPPPGTALGMHSLDIRFESENALPVVVSGTIEILGIPNQPPVAAFSNCLGGNRTVRANQAFDLDASASFDPDGDPIEYSWDLGSGLFGPYGLVVARTFSLPSDALLRVKVSDGIAESPPAECSITVQPNKPPKAAFKAIPLDGVTPLTVHFDASPSFDPDLDPISYEWTFSDRPDVRNDVSFDLVFSNPNPVNVTLKVTDSFNASDSITQQVLPYTVAAIKALAFQDAIIGQNLKVSVACTHSFDLKLELYSTNHPSPPQKIAETVYLCNSGFTALGPQLNSGLYQLKASFDPSIKCSRCEASTNFNVSPEAPVLPVPDATHFSAVAVSFFVLALIFWKRKK
ncbi:MAG: PKD domain-containing protein [Candidatus Diapherotrites archaeon]